MRIRTVKPEFWTDATMVQLPLMARLLFVGLWNCADDHGFLDDEPDRIAMQVLPREDSREVASALELLIACGRVDRYSDDSGSFLRIAHWERHQRVDHPSKSRIQREGARKEVIRAEDRRAVALKYGCEPGGTKEVACYFCEAPGRIYWHALSDGRPSWWVTFPDLELSHWIAESEGGPATSENLVLACRACNRRMATGDGLPRILASVRESSRGLAPERKGKEGKGKEDPAPRKRDAAPAKPTDPRHAPTVAALVEAFREVTGTDYAFGGGRDAKAVSELLSKAEPDEIVARWRRALRHQGFPSVRQVHELAAHFNHFAAGAAPKRDPGGLLTREANDQHANAQLRGELAF